MRCFVVGLLAVGLAAGTGLAQDDAVKKELKRLQGTWIPQSAQRDGKDFLERLQNDRLVIEGDKITVKHDNRDEKGSFKIDPTKKPATINLMPSDDQEKAVLGIYELKGDTLKICFVEAKGERPTEFTSTEGSRRMLIVLKRMK